MKQVKHICLNILIIVVCFQLTPALHPATRGGSPATQEGNALPFTPKLEKLIAETFFSDGCMSQEKINTYYSDIAGRYREIKRNLKRVYKKKEHQSSKKAGKRIKNKGEIK
ncbi:MAG: hypothetical protein GY765_41235, partial [bacterium]|nr:hypothetical protein [bacterium]